MPESMKGRLQQRQRTHEDIVEAAIRLLKGGTTPSMAEIAAEARMSRRTIYLHFPTLDQLLTDARIGLLSQQAIDAAIDMVDPGGDAETRVGAMIDAIIDNARSSLPLGRALIKLTVDTPPAAGGPRRGLRRIAWLEKALAPLRTQLPPDQFEQLISALAIVVGWEALIVLADVRGLDESARRDTIQWTARAVLRAALAKSSQG